MSPQKIYTLKSTTDSTSLKISMYSDLMDAYMTEFFTRELVYSSKHNCILLLPSACSPAPTSERIDLDEAVQVSMGSELRLGGDLANVEAFLKANGYEYSVDSNAGVIRAIKRNVAKGGFVTKSISVIFKIKDGKCESYETSVAYTGP